MNNKLYIIIIFIIISCNNKRVNSDKKLPPNIILINADDLGWKDAGFMGSDYYETPHLDQLAKQGMIFTEGYAGAANCAPSRACLITGMYMPRHGIYTVGKSEQGEDKDRKLIPTKNKVKLDSGTVTFPKILHDNGYLTCHAGKWHISDNPKDFGFDINIGGSNAGRPKSYYPPYGNVKLDSVDVEHLTDAIMKKTIKFIDTASPPFFLSYAPYAVHTPIQEIEEYAIKYKNKSGSNGQNNYAYASMVENLDRNIGLLIETLKRNNKYENTFIIFTSDNGGVCGITKQNPLRSGKGSYFEGGIREPYIFVWPNKIKPNTVSDVPIINIDIFPTIIELVGLNLNEYNYDGITLLPILCKEKKVEDRPLFWHFPIYLRNNRPDIDLRDPLFRCKPGSTIRFGNWKLHHNFENNTYELYNLKEDIGEKNNLIKEYPEKFEELLQMLNKWRAETNAPIPQQPNPLYKGG